MAVFGYRVTDGSGKPVAVGHLERYAADWPRENLPIKTHLAPPSGL